MISKKTLVVLNSYLNLIRGLFITILLIFSSLVFMWNIDEYALNPLEKMIKTITIISENPFEAIKSIKSENKGNKASEQDQL